MAHTGEENKDTLVYFSGKAPADSEDHGESDGRGDLRRAEGKLAEKVKGFLCNKCVLCLFISLVAIVIAMVTVKVMISSSLEGLSSQNSTMDDSGLEALEQLYVPSKDIQMKANTYFRLDKHNRTVWFLDFGHWDFESLLETNVTTEEFNVFVDYNIRKIRQSMRGLNGTDALGWAMVVNMDGFGLAQAFDFKAIGVFQEVVKRHFGFLKSVDYCIHINTSFWSRMPTALFRPIMGDLLDRYEVFGYDDWLPTLSERIPVDRLPPGYTSYVEE